MCGVILFELWFFICNLQLWGFTSAESESCANGVAKTPAGWGIMFKGFCFGVLLSPPLVHFKRTGCTTKHTAHHAMSLPIPDTSARALAKKALDTARNVTKQNRSNNLEPMWRTGHAIVFSGHRVSGGRMSIYKYIFIIYNLNIHKKVRTIAEQLCKDPVEHNYT